MITDKQLNTWIRHQRVTFNRGKMDARRANLLAKIPGWTWNKEESSWNEKYQLSLKYGVVGEPFKTPDGIKLGQWQTIMRRNGGNNKYMTPERKKLLEKIPGWAWRLREDSWNKNYQLSLKYGRVENLFKTPDGIRLGLWQRNMCINNGNNSSVTPERRKLLEKISGWSWSQSDDAWNEKYQLSLKYGVVKGQFKTPDGIHLGQWQRNMCRNGGNNTYTTPERRKLLEKLPGWTWNKPTGRPKARKN